MSYLALIVSTAVAEKSSDDASMDASFDRMQEDNRELKAVIKDYDTLCRGYGEKEIAARVRAIQEQELQHGSSAEWIGSTDTR